jgi:hypothetical protein
LQSLEHELGGVRIYARAIECAVRPDLKKEWEKYFEQTKSHVVALETVCKSAGIDATRETPGWVPLTSSSVGDTFEGTLTQH